MRSLAVTRAPLGTRIAAGAVVVLAVACHGSTTTDLAPTTASPDPSATLTATSMPQQLVDVIHQAEARIAEGHLEWIPVFANALVDIAYVPDYRDTLDSPPYPAFVASLRGDIEASRRVVLDFFAGLGVDDLATVRMIERVVPQMTSTPAWAQTDLLNPPGDLGAAVIDLQTGNGLALVEDRGSGNSSGGRSGVKFLGWSPAGEALAAIGSGDSSESSTLYLGVPGAPFRLLLAMDGRGTRVTWSPDGPTGGGERVED